MDLTKKELKLRKKLGEEKRSWRRSCAAVEQELARAR